MDFEKIRAGVSTAADVGVFVGFIMIAFQLQQNTVALDAQAKATMTAAYSAAETTMIGDAGAMAFAVSVTDPAEMTDSQIIEIWAYYASSLQPVISAYQALQQRVISHEAYLEQVSSFADSYLTTPFARIWWKHNKDTLPPLVMNDIDVALGRIDVHNKVILRFEGIRRDLDALKLGS